MKPQDYFKNKIILITGAGSGIGKALSEQIAPLSPAKIILADINEGSLNTAQNNIHQVNTEIHKVDVSSQESIQAMFEEVIAKNKHLDIVFNNAGIASGGEFKDYTFEDWTKIININLWGVIYGSSLAYRHMIKQKQGHIINTASLGGLVPEPMAAAYSTTKFAVVGLTTTLREEARAYGIKVSAACPGVINTPIFDTATFAGNADPEKVKNATLEHGAISPNLCAQRIIKGVARNKGIILVKPMDKIFWYTYRISPGLLSPVNQMIASYFRDNFQKDLQTQKEY